MVPIAVGGLFDEPAGESTVLQGQKHQMVEFQTLELMIRSDGHAFTKSSEVLAFGGNRRHAQLIELRYDSGDVLVEWSGYDYGLARAAVGQLADVV